jgi:hypothetical protein
MASSPSDRQSLALDLKNMSINVTPAQVSTGSGECSRSRSPSTCAHSHVTASRSALPHRSPKAFSRDIEHSSEAEYAVDVAQNATQPEFISTASYSDVSESGSFGLNPEWRPLSDVAGGMTTGSQFEELGKTIARELSRKYINVPSNEGTLWCRSKASWCHVLEIRARRGMAPWHEYLCSFSMADIQWMGG